MTDASETLVERAVKLLDACRRATVTYDRPDLTDRVDRARDRLVEPDINALVVGEFKQGKSTLVNGVLNVPLCPVSDDVATVVPTYVRHGEQAVAEIVAAPVASPGSDGEGRAAAPERRRIGLDEIPTWASELGNPENSRSIRAVELRVPRRLLASGLALIDTPGVGGLHSMYGAATMAALGTAEVVIFVTDASQELSAVELDVLRAAAAACPTVACVLTKIDLYPAWRRVAELDRRHLAAADLGDVPVIPVSSLLRSEALARSSKTLNDESGYPELLRFLNESVIGRSQQVAVRTAISSATFVLDQLEGRFAAERSVLADPDRAAAVAEELERARNRFEHLRARSARWQQTLGDGCQDLASEIDHDLRGRLRYASSAAEDAVDANDPADIWDDLAAWFRHQVAGHVAANTDHLRRSAAVLAARVADHFAVAEDAISHDVDVGAVPAIGGSPELSLERTPRGNTLLAAMRGSYGGILMFGLMGQVAGLSLVNPLTAVIGIGLGRRALKEERKRQLTMRRQQAKQSIRRYLDDVSFAVNKQSRDAIRRVQRDLRDEFTGRADQLQRSTREALSAAEGAAKRTVAEGRKRLKEIDAELARLKTVRTAADALADAAADREAAA